jgi:hypothetical protein
VGASFGSVWGPYLAPRINTYYKLQSVLGKGRFIAEGDIRQPAAADRDLFSLSAKTRISQLRSQQIDHRL